MGIAYIDDTPVDDGAPYRTGWDAVEFGGVAPREPSVTDTVGGKFVVYPQTRAVGERRGKWALYSASVDLLEKFKVESDMRALMYGARKIHLGGRYLNVFFLEAQQAADDSRKATRIAGIEAPWVAYDPFWYLNQPLSGIVTPVNTGDEWSLYDDNSIPTSIPDYDFTANTFTLNNWGTAFTFGAGTITAGPADETVYLKSGDDPNRVAVTLDGSGNGTFLATSELYLEIGNNTIRVENSGGTLVTVGGSFVIDFGNTYMRFK